MAGTPVQLKMLQPIDMETHWDWIKKAAESMYGPEAGVTEDQLTDLLTRLVSAQVQCWVAGQNNQVKTALLTTIERDSLFGDRYLHILGIQGFRDVTLISYFTEINDKLTKFCQRKNCKYIIIRANDPRVGRLIERYGAFQLPIYRKEV